LINLATKLWLGHCCAAPLFCATGVGVVQKRGAFMQIAVDKGVAKEYNFVNKYIRGGIHP